MKATFLIILIFILNTCFSQQFEGEIIFQNSYVSKNKDTPSEYLNKLFGTIHTYQVRNENYKLIGNGKLLQWQIYLSNENKLYTKLAAGEKLGIKDLNKEFEKVIKVEVNRKSTEILNQLCDEFIVYCKNSTQKYFIDSSLNLNPEIFRNSKFNNQLAFLLNNNILPFKMIIEDEINICESVAIKIKEEKIDEKIFEIK